MRRFELVEGSSSKFWQIEQDGNKLTIQWGKIGTAGQSQVKDFPDDSKATAEHDKLVKEKTKKGYSEVAAVSDPAAPAPKPRAPKAAAPEVAEAATAPAPVAASVVASAPVEVVVPNNAAVEIDWDKLEINRALVPHRFGRYRPSEAERNADPWKAVQSAWSKWKNHLPLDKYTISAELRPAVQEAHDWLSVDAPGPLSPLAAVAVEHLIDLRCDTDCYPPMRAISEASISKHGIGWIFDTVIAAMQIKFERYTEIDSVSFTLVPEVVGPNNPGRQTAARMAFVAQGLSDAAYAELLADAEKRWHSWTYFQKLRVLTVIPSHTKLADALGEEWLACNGKVEGYVASSYGPEGIEPEMDFAYSRPMMAKLAKKLVNRAFSGGQLVSQLWRLFDLVGADIVPIVKISNDAVDWAHGLITGLEVASLVRGPETAALMVSHLNAKKDVVPFAIDWLKKNPALAFPALADAVSGTGAIADRAAVILNEMDRTHPDLSEKVELRPASRAALLKLREKMAVKADASPEDLPKVLANPPWLSGKRAQSLPVVTNVTMQAYPDALHDNEEGALTQAKSEYETYSKNPRKYEEVSENVGSRWSGKYVSSGMTSLKKADVKKAFDNWPGDAWSAGYNILTPLVVLGIDAIAGYPRIAVGASALFAATLREIVESPKLAPFYAYARTLKSARKHAEQWFIKFPKAAIVGLIPTAVGNHTQNREQAESALQFLVSKGHGDLVRSIAASYGSEVKTAVEAVLGADPRDRYPAKLPKIPAWANVDKLPRPLLKGREKAIPKSAVEAIFMMLAFSTPESTYIGLEDVLAVCDRQSLEEFSWALFNEWQLGGASSKENWGMQQLGLFGGNEVARKLTPLIRNWPGESLQARAVSGLDILARIGTDLALMHLNGVAQKVKFKGLQEKAREKMDEVAQNRGLTADELADRLVPDLELDPDGSRTLDFGSRQFRISFDEALKPVVVDGSGKTLSDLPKANKSDDATKAKEADTVWKTLKKDVKAIAQNQIVRLELAMCAQRRWELDSFRALFLEHPLLIHLVRRLIWGIYSEDGARTGACRVAEDSSFADSGDNALTLPNDVYVGIVHPLELPESERAAFGQVLGDYNIVQPFPQIGRDTYAPTAKEAKSTTIERRHKEFAPLGKFLGLVEKGWRKGDPQDAGWIWDMYKSVAGGFVATLDLPTGIAADMQMTEPKQEIGTIYVSHKQKENVTLGDLPAVVFSELVRDLVQLGSAP
jgi:predicted DNA-binding WGR domain protein